MSAEGHRREAYFAELAKRCNQDNKLNLIVSKIKSCETTEEIYELGRRFRDGSEQGYPKDTVEAQKAAYECFRYVWSQGYNEPKVLHNIGLLYAKWRELARAEETFLLAWRLSLKKKSPLQASFNNYWRLKQAREHKTATDMSKERKNFDKGIKTLQQLMDSKQIIPQVMMAVQATSQQHGAAVSQAAMSQLEAKLREGLASPQTEVNSLLKLFHT